MMPDQDEHPTPSSRQDAVSAGDSSLREERCSDRPTLVGTPPLSDSGAKSERPSDRPTVVPELPPDVLVRQARSNAHGMAHHGTPDDESLVHPSISPSQTPTREPPDHEERNTQVEPIPTGWSISPHPNQDGALCFVDGHSRESVQPLPADPHLPAFELPRRSLDPGASLSDLYAVGNFTDAMREAEARLAANPDDEDAMRYADECRRTLTRMYLARLGPAGSRLRIAVPLAEIRWMTLDHRAGFVLSLIDGQSTVDEVLDICGMARLEALRILVELYEKGVVTIAD